MHVLNPPGASAARWHDLRSQHTEYPTMKTKQETAPHWNAELLRALVEYRKLVDEINAGKHKVDGNVSKYGCPFC